MLLPGERIPLHIFEERYKRMIAACLEGDRHFGIVYRDDEGARSVGCTARVDEVVERLDDGRLNIVVRGEAPFRVLDRFDSPDYPQAEAEMVADAPAEAPDREAAESARDAFAELAERATGEPPDEEELGGADSYSLAGRVELPAETKQRLLEMRDEDERMTLLANALRAVDKALDRAEEVAEQARGNGKVSFG